MPEISIVLPIYNTPVEYFHISMESILHQTFKDYEVILVDDGSTNLVAEICDLYVSKDERFHVIHQENNGLPKARNRGTEAARGKWIIYMDPDDWWEKDTLEQLIRVIRQYKLEILVFSYFDNYDDKQIEKRCWDTLDSEFVIVSEEQKRNMQIGLMDETQRKMPGYFGSACMHIANLEFLKKNNIKFDEKLRKSEDMFYDLELLDKAQTIGVLDVSFYHYRHHTASACNKYTPDIEEILSELGKKLYSFNKNKDVAYLRAMQVYMMRNYINILRLKYFHPDNRDSEREKRKQWMNFIRFGEGFEELKKVDILWMMKIRKIWGTIFCFSFKLKSYSLVKIAYQIYYRLKKEWI